MVVCVRVCARVYVCVVVCVYACTRVCARACVSWWCRGGGECVCVRARVCMYGGVVCVCAVVMGEG